MSDESDRRAGRAELDRLNAAALKRAEPPPPKAKKKRVQSDLSSVMPKGRKSLHRGKSVDEVVDEAVSGAKLPY